MTRLHQSLPVVLASCLAYLMIFPIGHTPVLVAVLVLMGAASVALILLEHRTLNRALWPTLAAVGLLILLGVSVGIGNEGWWHSLIASLAAPVLFWVWAIAIGPGTLPVLLRTAAWTTIALSALILVGALVQLNSPHNLPEFLMAVFGLKASGGFGSVLVSVYGTGTLIAATPMWITAAIIGGGHFLPPRWLLITAAAAAGVASTMSSRRAVLAVAILAPLTVLVAYFLTQRKLQYPRWSLRGWLIAGGATVVTLAVAAAILASPMGQRLINGVSGLLTGKATTDDEAVRLEQIPRLWEGFLQSPLWGQGVGATVPGYQLHPTRPWVFDMQYNMLLFHTGVLGGVLALVMLGSAVWALWRAQRDRPLMHPVLASSAAAAVGVLVANALNPILQAPGHFWGLFLVVAIVNVALSAPKSPPEPGVRRHPEGLLYGEG